MEATPRELLICQDERGREAFTEWLFNVLDPATRARVMVQLDRIEDGNFSNVEPVGEGVSELKMDFGPGYRAYFGQRGKEVHLICGGNKSSQSVDIALAKEFWRKHE